MIQRQFLDHFKTLTNGIGIDVDGSGGTRPDQCVDVIKFVVLALNQAIGIDIRKTGWGATASTYPNDWPEHAKSTLIQIPKDEPLRPCDFVVWDQGVSAARTGHVALFDRYDGEQPVFYGQNGGVRGNYCHTQKLSMNKNYKSAWRINEFPETVWQKVTNHLPHFLETLNNSTPKHNPIPRVVLPTHPDTMESVGVVQPPVKQVAMSTPMPVSPSVERMPVIKPVSKGQDRLHRWTKNAIYSILPAGAFKGFFGGIERHIDSLSDKALLIELGIIAVIFIVICVVAWRSYKAVKNNPNPNPLAVFFFDKLKGKAKWELNRLTGERELIDKVEKYYQV